jgi:hypothetical protein
MAKRKRLAVLDNWDEIQFDPVSDPPNVSRMAKGAAVEAITAWFLSNFEDPVHSTPYESAEGGYQYIWGGPYEARDIIENVFSGHARELVIEDAINELENESSVWVPASSRQQPPEPDVDEPDPIEVQSPEQLHQAVKQRISDLEDLLDKVPRPPSGIGHNHPPEPMDIEPLDGSDREEIRDALTVLKSQPAEPTNPAPAAAALLTFETKRAKLGKWLAQQGQLFTREAVKEAGKQFGKWAPRVFWLWFLDQMFGVSEAVHAWLHAIQLPF